MPEAPQQTIDEKIVRAVEAEVQRVMESRRFWRDVEGLIEDAYTKWDPSPRDCDCDSVGRVVTALRHTLLRTPSEGDAEVLRQLIYALTTPA